MTRLMKICLAAISGNAPMQHLFEGNVKISNYLMGIGAGGVADSSGEKAISDKLKKHAARQCPVAC